MTACACAAPSADPRSTSGIASVRTRPMPSRTTGWSSTMRILGIGCSCRRMVGLADRERDDDAGAAGRPARDAQLAARGQRALAHSEQAHRARPAERLVGDALAVVAHFHDHVAGRSEEHTSELQSLAYLVCRLLLE